MPNFRSDLIRIASELPQGDPTRREILSALKQAGTYTMFLFSNSKAALRGAIAYAEEGEETGETLMRAESWANVNKKSGEYTSGSGGHGNAVLVSGDVPKMIAAIKSREPRLKFVVLDKVESPKWGRGEPASVVDLRSARRP